MVGPNEQAETAASTTRGRSSGGRQSADHDVMIVAWTLSAITPCLRPLLSPHWGCDNCHPSTSCPERSPYTYATKRSPTSAASTRYASTSAPQSWACAIANLADTRLGSRIPPQLSGPGNSKNFIDSPSRSNSETYNTY